MIGFDFKRHTDIWGHHVSFTTKDVKDADKAFQSLIEGKPVEVIIRTKKIKRSLDANAYLWVLCDEIAKKLHTTKEEVYKHHVQDVGVFDFLAIPTKAVPQFVKSWNEKGLGWFVRVYNDCKIPKCTKVCVYYGSSSYDSKQMARLVDSLVQEADALGIETKGKSELDKLHEEWGERYG